jgi:uncharacterized protein YndB with AHSA1/START domain
MRTLFAAILAILAATPAAADVRAATPQGFEIVNTVIVSVTAKDAYAALTKPARWWNPEHTFSGSAANLTLDVKPGGCFCEKLKDGGWAHHLEVTMVKPGESIEFHGGLGPLRSEGVNGVLRWVVTPVDGGATITQSYVVGGYFRKSAEVFGSAVDKVMQEQMDRLQSLLNTGAPVPSRLGD